MIEQIDAGANFLREFEKYATVLAAFWLKASEEHSWYLYVASDDSDGRKLKPAYGEVGRIAAEMRDPNFDPFQVKLIKGTDALAKSALAILRRFQGRMTTHFHRRDFGATGAEEIYLYPNPIAVS